MEIRSRENQASNFENNQIKSAASLKNLYVVTLDEGLMIGKIDLVLINPNLNKVSALFVKGQFWKREGYLVPMSEIVNLGKHVVLINSLEWCDKLKIIGSLRGRSFSNIKNISVTSHDGEVLGYLKDILFRSKSGNISELCLTEGTPLKVEGLNISIGRDEIIVPAHYFDLYAPKVNQVENSSNSSFQKPQINKIRFEEEINTPESRD